MASQSHWLLRSARWITALHVCAPRLCCGGAPTVCTSHHIWALWILHACCVYRAGLRLNWHTETSVWSVSLMLSPICFPPLKSLLERSEMWADVEAGAHPERPPPSCISVCVCVSVCGASATWVTCNGKHMVSSPLWQPPRVLNLTVKWTETLWTC